VPVWSYVDERHVRAALDRAGFAHLLDDGDLWSVSGWQHADVEGRSIWYYGGVAETRPDELRRFVELLLEDAPDGYEPHLIKLRKGSKAPAKDRPWKHPDARCRSTKRSSSCGRGTTSGSPAPTTTRS
jgi:hypothetical protein